MSTLAQSLDINAERLAQLKALFPETFSEGKIDFNRLRAALGDANASSRENYELSWAGKADARAEIQKRTTATLRPDVANSVNWDATQNLYIEGENLEVLRTLQKAYFGKVKMIYIDPPYNTGNDSFVYPDDYSETLKDYQARTGQTDEAGFVNKQTLWKKNSKENGQFHSVWLSMMYPRLFLARNLLRDDGVIFVSIDDNEAADLKLLMDEIFGEENFVATFTWETKQAARGVPPKNMVMSNHEYVFCYGRCGELVRLNGLERDESDFDNSDKDARGAWRSESIRATGKQNNFFEIKDPKTNNKFYGNWAFSEESIVRMVSEKLIIFPTTPNGTPRQKKFFDSYLNDTKAITSSLRWYSTETSTKKLMSLFNEDKVFDFPKPIDLIKFFSKQASKENDIILDFFSGSGTTAQAVLELNEEDGGNRQFICVQMPEVLEEDSEAYKAGYRTIADIGRARIKKVIEQIEAKRQEANKQKKLEDAEASAPQVLGFNAFKLAPSNFKEWRTDVTEVSDLFEQMDYHVDSTKPDSEAGSMVYELLLKLALPITTPIQCHDVGSAKVYMATPDSGRHVAMFFETLANNADDVLAFILKTKPVKVLCLNKCFVESQALTNFGLQLQDAAIALEVL